LVTIGGIAGDGTLGISILAGSATDTAGNTANATGPSAAVVIDSHAPIPTIVWASPAVMSYGTPLGTTQLNATANTPGTFVYTPDTGTILPPGTNTLHLAFQPDNTIGYTNTVAEVQLIVQKLDQTLNISAPNSIPYGGTPVVAVATATSGLAPDLAIVSGPGTLTAGQLTATDTGTIIVRATQPGNGYYNAAPYADWSITVTNGPTRVAGRWIFYNRSAWDGNNAAANPADDAAIATDKSALLPGAVATFTNYTSYSRGINGIMVDLQYFDGAPAHHSTPSISAADLQFRVGNDNQPENWTNAPTPLAVTVRTGAGIGGSDRVTIIWADNAIQKQWLAVKVLATANTAVAAVDRAKEHGARDIRVVCLVAAPEGIERLRGIHPDVRIWTAAIDEGLNEQAFIVPGLGDAGDRAYGTK
jgi:hypothetical protein